MMMVFGRQTFPVWTGLYSTESPFRGDITFYIHIGIDSDRNTSRLSSSAVLGLSPSRIERDQGQLPVYARNFG